MNFDRMGVAMPEFRPWRKATAALVLVTSFSAAWSAEAPAGRTALDSALFYQLLVGEMELRNGDPGTAYQVFMDAARRTRDPQLFRRAMDVALQARAGAEALATTRAWREALPTDLDPLRLELQILTALNRLAEAGPPLSALIVATPAAERGGLIAALPRFLERATDKRATAVLLDTALAPYLKGEATRTASVVASGRAWLAANDPDRALGLARDAAAADPSAPGPVLLAMELRAVRPDAEQLVVAYFSRPGAEPALRLAWARVLTAAQRYPESIEQLEAATRQQPDQAAPWLMLGALHLELRHFAEADAALLRYVALAQAQTAPSAPSAPSAQPAVPADMKPAGAAPGPAPASTAAPAAAASSPGSEPKDDDETDADDDTTRPDQGLVQAWLMLAQSAEQRGDFAGAETWLARIEDPQRALEVQTRRAMLMARQGQVDNAVASLRRVPERNADDARAKLVAEAQLLRDVKRMQAAYDVYEQAVRRFPEDIDLLYEQAMVAEKINRIDDMERLLRQVIAMKPDHGHAHNALGYSLADRGQRLPEARDLIRRALELKPGDPFITDSLGWVEFRLGNLDEAERQLRRAWTSRPDTEIGAHLGEVLWALGRQDDARRVWRQALARDSANEVLRETLARLQVGL
jgi:tetratricopeptide (TPR) repeat protein